MRKILFFSIAIALLFGSCSTQKSISKNSVPFPGMTVTRADYSLSKDVSASVEIKEISTLMGYFVNAKAVGEQKRSTRQGNVLGYGLDPASKIAVYRLLDANPTFDYLTNIRIQRESTKKWYGVFSKHSTKITVTAKGITLNTDK
jgi:hypothetical protein